MQSQAASHPSARPAYYVYGIIDPTTEPPTLIGVEMSRKECRQKIEWSPDADKLRIRRGRFTLYQR